jgi:hypothetical protein
MMPSKLLTRIKKLEIEAIPMPPPVQIVWDTDDLEEKAREFREKYPGQKLPMFLIITRYAKPADAGEGGKKWTGSVRNR